jgi:hypothetical protein
VLPLAAHGIFDQLNWKMELSGKEERFSLKDAAWGKNCRTGTSSANLCRCFRGLKGKGNALSERFVILGGDAGNI